MSRFLNAALLCAALVVPIATVSTTLLAEDQKTVVTYHDKQHGDDHQWNSREDRAYRAWGNENHRKYSEFNKLNDNDQQTYWNWRHEHSDALLKIDIK
ncbi:MAG: hypothetical protein ABSG25_09640 [Bryobacteraceae bacterium]